MGCAVARLGLARLVARLVEVAVVVLTGARWCLLKLAGAYCGAAISVAGRPLPAAVHLAKRSANPAGSGPSA